jgi:purine nucleoside permease
MRQLVSRWAVWPLAFAAVMAVGQGGSALGQERDPAALPIKVVIVTMFEFGEDQGDRPGEFQTWVERLPLPETLPFSQGYRDLRINREKGVLGIVTGIGTARSAASIMALGMDPRFDLSRSYWLVAGIAGADAAPPCGALRATGARGRRGCGLPARPGSGGLGVSADP